MTIAATIDALETQRADSIYRLGPEVLAARSFAVYAGPVARYAKQVTEMSQPGADGFELKWVISGRLEQPAVLKGTVPPGGVLPFLRQEQSGMLPQPPSVAPWERDLGDLLPGDEAVLFFHGDSAKPSLKVLPSRAGEQGLAALVRDIARIQALPDAARQASAWLTYLLQARSDDARQVALRSLVNSPATNWPMLQPALQQLLAALPRNSGLRTYTTGLVGFALVQDKWGGDDAAAIDFMCREFDGTQDAGLALHQVLGLKMLLNHLSAPLRQPLRQRIFQSLKRRMSAGGVPPAIQQQIDQIHDSHPGQF